LSARTTDTVWWDAMLCVQILLFLVRCFFPSHPSQWSAT
jgi:hypothetical protein